MPTRATQVPLAGKRSRTESVTAGTAAARLQRTRNRGVPVYWVDWLRVVIRRWYVVLPALLVTLLIEMFVAGSVAPSYKVESSLLLLPPVGVSTADAAKTTSATNPFAALPLSSVAGVLAQKMLAPETSQKIADAGMVGKYTVVPRIDNTPVIDITAEGKTADAARAEANLVGTMAAQQLTSWQTASVQANRVTMRVLIAPGPATPVLGSKIRAIVVVVALGGAASLYLAFLVEAFVERRRQRARGERRRPSRAASAA